MIDTFRNPWVLQHYENPNAALIKIQLIIRHQLGRAAKQLLLLKYSGSFDVIIYICNAHRISLILWKRRKPYLKRRAGGDWWLHQIARKLAILADAHCGQGHLLVHLYYTMRHLRENIGYSLALRKELTWLWHYTDVWSPGCRWSYKMWPFWHRKG